MPDLDAIVGAVGSGGFMAGVCVAAKVEVAIHSYYYIYQWVLLDIHNI